MLPKVTATSTARLFSTDSHARGYGNDFTRKESEMHPKDATNFTFP